MLVPTLATRVCDWGLECLGHSSFVLHKKTCRRFSPRRDILSGCPMAYRILHAPQWLLIQNSNFCYPPCHLFGLGGSNGELFEARGAGPTNVVVCPNASDRHRHLAHWSKSNISEHLPPVGWFHAYQVIPSKKTLHTFLLFQWGLHLARHREPFVWSLDPGICQTSDHVTACILH